MSLKATILDEIRIVAASQRKTLAPLTDDLALNDSGLDSLCFAILVARLEDTTGCDPFASTDGARFPRTIGEFIALYEAPALAL
jgi:acyl carrier protein